MCDQKFSVKKNYDRTASIDSYKTDTEGMQIIRTVTNTFKETILRYVFTESKRANNVLNLGSGRGGDIQALGRICTINKMVAVDISGASLDELVIRHSSMRRKSITSLDCVEADFTSKDFFDLLTNKLSIKYDKILVNLCIHYISPSSLGHFVQNLCRISTGSICIIYYDSIKLKKLCDRDISYKGKLIGSIKTLSDKSYNISLGNSIDNLTEYFVDEETILSACAKEGFKLTLNTGPSVNPLSDPERYVSCLKALVFKK